MQLSQGYPQAPDVTTPAWAASAAEAAAAAAEAAAAAAEAREAVAGGGAEGGPQQQQLGGGCSAALDGLAAMGGITLVGAAQGAHVPCLKVGADNTLQVCAGGRACVRGQVRAVHCALAWLEAGSSCAHAEARVQHEPAHACRPCCLP